MRYNQRKTIYIDFTFTYDDIQYLLNSVISFIMKNYNQPSDTQINIYVTIPQGQSFSFSSLEDFKQNFSRSNHIDSVSFEMFYNDPVNKKDYIFINNHFISRVSIDLNASSDSQTLSQDLVDSEAIIISQYIAENHPQAEKHTIINKIDNILSRSKLIYMILGAIITAAINFLFKLFIK